MVCCVLRVVACDKRFRASVGGGWVQLIIFFGGVCSGVVWRVFSDQALSLTLAVENRSLSNLSSLVSSSSGYLEFKLSPSLFR